MSKTNKKNKENKYARNKVLIFLLWSLCDILKTSGVFQIMCVHICNRCLLIVYHVIPIQLNTINLPPVREIVQQNNLTITRKSAVASLITYRNKICCD